MDNTLREKNKKDLQDKKRKQKQQMQKTKNDKIKQDLYFALEKYQIFHENRINKQRDIDLNNSHYQYIKKNNDYIQSYQNLFVEEYEKKLREVKQKYEKNYDELMNELRNLIANKERKSDLNTTNDAMFHSNIYDPLMVTNYTQGNSRSSGNVYSQRGYSYTNMDAYHKL